MNVELLRQTQAALVSDGRQFLLCGPYGMIQVFDVHTAKQIGALERVGHLVGQDAVHEVDPVDGVRQQSATAAPDAGTLVASPQLVTGVAVRRRDRAHVGAPMQEDTTRILPQPARVEPEHAGRARGGLLASSR